MLSNQTIQLIFVIGISKMSKFDVHLLLKIYIKEEILQT